LNFFTFCSLNFLSLSDCFFSFSNLAFNLSMLLSCSKFYRRTILLS
jgi:hypothetical protein